jgi:Uma2 family endonuclease
MVDLARARMTTQEFLQLPESSEPIELINGEIIVSPTPKNPHQEAVGDIYLFLRQHIPGGKVISRADGRDIR